MEESTRPAVIEDLPELEALAAMARAEVRGIKGGHAYLDREARPDMDSAALQQSIEAPDELVLLGLIDDVIVAFAGVIVVELRTGEKVGDLSEIYVMPDARGVAVGEVMLDAAMEWARSRDCVRLEGWVHPGNRDAKNFFERAKMVTRLLRVSTGLQSPADG